MHDVFISYSKEDQRAARMVADRLAEYGFSVFLDRGGIVSGDSWSAHQANELNGAGAVLALLSSDSRRSHWVQSEVQAALERKKVVIPVLLDEHGKDNWVWPLLATRDSIRLDPASSNIEAQLESLVETLILHLRLGPEHVATSSGTPRSASSRNRSVFVIALISAAIGALVASLWL